MLAATRPLLLRQIGAPLASASRPTALPALRCPIGHQPWLTATPTCSAAAQSRLMLPRHIRHYSDIDERRKARNAVGPFNIRAAALFVVTGIGLFFYFKKEKEAVEEKKRADMAQTKVGRPKIGGEFDLVMPTPISHPSQVKQVQGRRFTDQDLLGAFSLIYFGFTNCPDICPEELDKMAEIVDRIDAKHGPTINPVFITCDPARDTLAATAIYASEFHPRMVALTGEYEKIKAACKAYRVYFSTPPGASPTDDYLVDHSIFFYLMDPEGKFVDAFGRSVNAEEATAKVMGYVEQWKAAGHPIEKADAKDRIVQDESRRV